MTKVTFEVAALAGALTAAAKVAPTRGAAFEKAAGILLDITADECIVMSTDTYVRYSTWLTPEEFEGDPISWRIPSRIFPELLSKLRTGVHKTLVLEQDGQVLKMTHGSTRATFNLMVARDFPRWEPFSPDNMHEVHGLAKAIGAVTWAAAKTGDAPLIGVHLDGENVIASDRYRIASVPCPLVMDAPVTIPISGAISTLKSTDSIMMRVDGAQVCIMPDECTQISLTAYGVDYPPVQRLMITEYEETCTVSKEALTETIDIAMTMAGSDRMPKLHLLFGREQIAAMVENDQTGRVGHVLDVPGQATWPRRHEIRFAPDNIISALGGCVGDKVTFGWNPALPKAPVFLAGADDVRFWLAPRQKTSVDAA